MEPGSRKISMVWWLALLFAVVAGLSIVVASEITRLQSESALRSRAEDVAAGRSFRAARTIREALEQGSTLAQAVTLAERREQLSALVVTEGGRPLIPVTESRRAFVSAESVSAATTNLQQRERYIDAGEPVIVVGLRLGRPPNALLVTGTSRGSLNTELDILSRARRDAILLTLPISIVLGVAVAMLISLRVRRIAAAAAKLESGDFESSLQSRFPDEIGLLARSFERMRGQLRQSFTRIESERARLQILLSRLHQGVVVVDRNLDVDFANPAAGRITRTPTLAAGQLLPEPWEGFSLVDFTASLFLAHSVMQRSRVAVGGDREIEVVGIPRAGGGQETVILVLTDLSEEARKERAERDFVANAAHELRTPLSTIIGSVDVLMSPATQRDEDRSRFLRHIRREAVRLNRLSHSLLVLARAQAGHDARTDETIRVAPLLARVCESIEPKQGVNLVVTSEPDLEAAGNPDLLEQVVFNLVANAVAHTESGSIHVRASALAGGCRISVVDTGSGIAPEERERIFERFYRAGAPHGDGFGLGLSIAQSCVTVLAGDIEVVSTPGVGTTATVTLPAARPGVTSTLGTVEHDSEVLS